MGRKKNAPMDKLAQDMIQCKKDGYGVHYGAWRAAQYEKGIMNMPKPKGYKYICFHCGKEFYAPNKKIRKYCSYDCTYEAYRLKQLKESEPKEKRQAVKKPVEKVCPLCGKTFMAESYRNKYCGEFCQRLAQVQRAKEYYHRKAEEAKENV